MSTYRHAFFKAARTTQPALATGADIEHLDALPRTYWVVLATPNDGTPLAQHLDADGDGRIRVPDVLGAVDWLKPRLASFDRLLAPLEGLSAEDFRADTPEGKGLQDLFKELSPDGAALDCAALTAAFDAFAARPANGDGAVPADAAPEALRPAIQAIASVAKAEGVSRDAIAAFDAAVAARSAWVAADPKGLAPAAVDAVNRLRGKVDAYFLPCGEAGAEPAQADLFGGQAPLALRDGINALWRKDTEALAEALGKDTLSAEDWLALKAQADAANAWRAAEPEDGLEALSAEALQAALDGETRKAIEALIAADEAAAPLATAFGDLRKFAVLREGLLRFLRNFVNVADLYPPKAKPTFLEGLLYMDGRCCTLCFPLDAGANVAAHAALSKESRCSLAYCKLERQGAAGGNILAVFTAGSTGNLYVGKRGLYIDDDGLDWDATITTLDINTISLTEAFFAPWRKIAATCAETVRKLVGSKGDAAAASASSVAVAKTDAVVSGTPPAAAPAAPAAPVPAPAAGSQMASVATLGIALSFVASAVAAIASAITSAPLWKTGAVVLAIVLAVSIPSVILAWFRLRNRDLAPILNASGWAINLRIGLTARLGAFFTHQACYVGRCFVRRPKQPKEA